MLSGLGHCLLDRSCIALIGTMQRHRDDSASLHVDRMFGLVGEMGAPILHLRDARVRIVRMYPILIAPFLRALPIDARQIGSCRRGDARCLRELRQERLVGLATVASYDAAQRGIRFQGRGMDANRLASDQARAGEYL